MPINEAIDNRIALTPGSYPLYPEAYQKSLQTIDLDFYFHKAKMNHFDLIEDTKMDAQNRNSNIFLGMVKYFKLYFHDLTLISRIWMFIKPILDQKLDWMSISIWNGTNFLLHQHMIKDNQMKVNLNFGSLSTVLVQWEIDPSILLNKL